MTWPVLGSINLGAPVGTIVAGDRHTCALLFPTPMNVGLRAGAVKCWGANDRGQLGLGDQEARGDGANEMGRALPYVDLGAGRAVVSLVAGGDTTCALLETGDMKCWGANTWGQLGRRRRPRSGR